MYFKLDVSRPDPPSFDGPMRRREGFLISVLGHVLLVVLVLLIPRLPFVQEVVQRLEEERAARNAELLEERFAEQRQAERFVFVQPRIDTEALEPPDVGMLSDLDRAAMAPERSAEPLNPVPFARGNSSELVILPELAEEVRGDGPGLDPADGVPDGETVEELASPEDAVVNEAEVLANAADTGVIDDRELGEVDINDPGTVGNDAPRTASRIPPPGVQAPLSGGSLGEVMQNLERYVDQETFDNPSGGGGQFGPSIQFDTMGVEFGPWIRRFIAQIKRNWLVPYAAMAFKGHSVVTFNVHKNGTLTDVTVIQPSTIDSFNLSARNALLASDPTQPLPSEYPADKAFFTVTFYYNERPPL